MINRVLIGLGSNIEDRAYYLKRAIEELQSNPSFIIGKYSSIYETAPIGYTEQGPFLNMVVELLTNLYEAQQDLYVTVSYDHKIKKEGLDILEKFQIDQDHT